MTWCTVRPGDLYDLLYCVCDLVNSMISCTVGLVARGDGASLPGTLQEEEGPQGQAPQDSEEQEIKVAS